MSGMAVLVGMTSAAVLVLAVALARSLGTRRLRCETVAAGLGVMPGEDGSGDVPATDDAVGPMIAFEVRRDTSRTEKVRDYMGPRLTDFDLPPSSHSPPSYKSYSPPPPSSPSPPSSSSSSGSSSTSQSPSTHPATSYFSQSDSTASDGLYTLPSVGQVLVALVLVAVASLAVVWAVVVSATGESEETEASAVAGGLPTQRPQQPEQTPSTSTTPPGAKMAPAEADDPRGTSIDYPRSEAANPTPDDPRDPDDAVSREKASAFSPPAPPTDAAPDRSPPVLEQTKPEANVAQSDLRSATPGERAWTDVSGRKLQAAWIGYENGAVALSVNGRSYQVPLERLSQEDRAYLVGQAMMAGDIGRPSGSILVRTWTDSSGKFTIEGAFVSEGAKGVSLLQTDGRLVVVPRDRLSVRDQQFLSRPERHVSK